MRNHLLIPILLFTVMIFSPALSAEERITVKRVVYDLKTGDIKKLKLYLISAVANNSIHYEKNFEELKVTVVIHGNSYKFFQKNMTDPDMIELGKRLHSFHETYDVTFQICEVGLKKRKIPQSTLYDFVEIVPNATIALIDSQNEGYAYLPLY